MTQQQEQQRIELLEKDVLGINFRLDSQGKVLEEIRDVLVQQKDILQNVTSIRQTVNQIREDVDELEDTFESRKQVTDNNNRAFSDFVSKFKGGLAVALFFFGVIQGSVAFVLSDNYDTHKHFTQQFQELKVENAIIKEKLRVYSLDKNVHKIIEDSKANN